MDSDELRGLKVGDVIPFAPGEKLNRTALGYAKARKTRMATILAKSEGRAARNEHEAMTRKIDQGNRERAQRLSDPYEQAKAFLQRKGYAVFAANLCSPPRKGIVVGRKTMPDKKAVMAYAETQGWQRQRLTKDRP